MSALVGELISIRLRGQKYKKYSRCFGLVNFNNPEARPHRPISILGEAYINIYLCVNGIFVLKNRIGTDGAFRAHPFPIGKKA